MQPICEEVSESILEAADSDFPGYTVKREEEQEEEEEEKIEPLCLTPVHYFMSSPDLQDRSWHNNKTTIQI